MSDLDENTIMLEVIDGDVDKLGILYERYKRPLYGYFFKLTSGNMAASEDLVQSVFYKALKYKHSFKGTGTFAKWLFSIAHNLGIDHFRKNSKISVREISPEEEGLDSFELDIIERKEELTLLQKALCKLGNDEREVILLAKIKLLKYKEIAEISNCSEGAVKARIFRALKRLREIYKELETSDYERARHK